MWQDAELDDQHIAWAREAQAIEPWSSARATSTTCRPTSRSSVRAAFDAEKFERLQALKRRYDPANVLRRNQNIPPG